MKETIECFQIFSSKNQSVTCIYYRINSTIDLWIGQEKQKEEQPSISRQSRRDLRKVGSTDCGVGSTDCGRTRGETREKHHKLNIHQETVRRETGDPVRRALDHGAEDQEAQGGRMKHNKHWRKVYFVIIIYIASKNGTY